MIGYGVVAFDRDLNGVLRATGVEKADSDEVAQRRAEELAGSHVGAVVFTELQGAEAGMWQRRELIAWYGDVDTGALQNDDRLSNRVISSITGSIVSTPVYKRGSFRVLTSIVVVTFLARSVAVALGADGSNLNIVLFITVVLSSCVFSYMRWTR